MSNIQPGHVSCNVTLLTLEQLRSCCLSAANDLAQRRALPGAPGTDDPATPGQPGQYPHPTPAEWCLVNLHFALPVMLQGGNT